DPAADAQLRPHIGLVQQDLLAVPARDLLFISADGLRARRADLFADHAWRLHRPRQAAAAIAEGGAAARRPGRGVRRLAELLAQVDLLDRTRRADLAAQGAVELAEAGPEIHDRRPQPLQATLGERRGLEHVGRADVDALVALDAALEELRLGDGARRADRLRGVALGVHRLRVAQERIREHARQPGEQPAPARHVWRFDDRVGQLRDHAPAEQRRGALLDRAEDALVHRHRRDPEGERVLRAVVDAVEAHEALALAQRLLRIGGALAVPHAQVAVGALGQV